MKKLLLFTGICCVSMQPRARERSELKILCSGRMIRMPSFIGDRNAFLLQHYRLDKTLFYGTCTLDIHFDDKGNITGKPKVIRASSKKLGKEVVRIVRLMPAWNPAIRERDGKPVSFNTDIQFSISRE